MGTQMERRREARLGTVNSDAHRKPKYPWEQAAENITQLERLLRSVGTREIVSIYHQVNNVFDRTQF